MTMRRKIWIVSAFIWTAVLAYGLTVLLPVRREIDELQREQQAMRRDLVDWHWVTKVSLSDDAPAGPVETGMTATLTPLALIKRLQRPSVQLTRIERQDPNQAFVEIRGDFSELVTFLGSVEGQNVRVTRLALNEGDGRLALYAVMGNQP